MSVFNLWSQMTSDSTFYLMITHTRTHTVAMVIKVDVAQALRDMRRLDTLCTLCVGPYGSHPTSWNNSVNSERFYPFSIHIILVFVHQTE